MDIPMCSNFTSENGNTFFPQSYSGMDIFAECSDGYWKPPQARCGEDGEWKIISENIECMQVTEEMDRGTLAFLSIMVIIALVLIIFLMVCCRKKKTRRYKSNTYEMVEGGNGRSKKRGPAADKEVSSLGDSDEGFDEIDQNGNPEYKRFMADMRSIVQTAVQEADKKAVMRIRAVLGIGKGANETKGLLLGEEPGNKKERADQESGDGIDDEDDEVWGFHEGEDGVPTNRSRVFPSLNNGMCLVREKDYKLVNDSESGGIPIQSGIGGIDADIYTTSVSSFACTYDKRIMNGLFTLKSYRELDKEQFEWLTSIMNSLKECDKITELIAFDRINQSNLFVKQSLDLRAMLDQKKAYSSDETTLGIECVKDLASQLTKALRFIHKNKISHRNINPGCIYLEGSSGSKSEPGYNLRLGDFEFAFRCTKGIEEGVSPPEYNKDLLGFGFPIPEFSNPETGDNGIMAMLLCENIEALKSVDLYLTGMMFAPIFCIEQEGDLKGGVELFVEKLTCSDPKERCLIEL